MLKAMLCRMAAVNAVTMVAAIASYASSGLKSSSVTDSRNARVAALDVVAEPLVARGVSREAAAERARATLARLNLPERLWSLPPATFSGGEQQRVNIARGFITDHPILLLDEPTASLDARNREVVIGMIAEKKQAGVAMLGIFHDADVRDAVADRLIDVTAFAGKAAA